MNEISFTLNGRRTVLSVNPSDTLLHALRENVGVTGTKEGCLDGNCGACTVKLDDRIVVSCLVLAVECDGKEVQTVEGLSTKDGLSPIQKAFLKHAALQCGICTPGFLVAIEALLKEDSQPDEAKIRMWLAGNLCRCTGYDKIVKAVQAVAETLKK